jgi:hypothetical protein
MCRSVLSPVSEFELEDLGGKAYLDKQRDKLEKLPPPLKGFGNEPGLDGGRPPGQPPVVRTPRGPKGGEVMAEPVRSEDGGVGYVDTPPRAAEGTKTIMIHDVPVNSTFAILPRGSDLSVFFPC